MVTSPRAERSMLVTGGASGLGAAIAHAAAATGYRVGVIDLDQPLDGDVGGRSASLVTSYVASVTDDDAIEQVFDDFGVPDVVVNNAGVVRFGPLVSQSIDDFRCVLEVNLLGCLLVSRAAARRWIADGSHGTIVNITSINGIAAGPNAGVYGASKAGIALLTAQMAIEWGPHGIRVNAVAPGLIDAGMSEPIYADAATRAARQSKVPLGRLGTATDVADAVLFLASEQAGYIHGQNIVVDGGVTGSVIAHLPRPAAIDSVGHST